MGPRKRRNLNDKKEMKLKKEKITRNKIKMEKYKRNQEKL